MSYSELSVLSLRHRGGHFQTRRKGGSAHRPGLGGSSPAAHRRPPPRAAGRKGRPPPRPAPPNLKALAHPLGPFLTNKSFSHIAGCFPLASRAPRTAAHRPWLLSQGPSGRQPRHVQPGAARPPAAHSPRRSGPAPALRRLPRAPAPPGRARHTPRSRTPRLVLLRRGHPGQARPPPARHRPAGRVCLRRREARHGSLRVSRDVAASLPGRGSPPAVPPAARAGAPRGSLLRPPGPRRHRYEVAGRPGAGRGGCSVEAATVVTG